MAELAARRERLVRVDIEGRGITNPRLLDAFRRVPREAFAPPELADRAYENTVLPIGRGQTLSQPSLVAEMIDALRLDGSERVLEIGAGSGYAVALLAHVAREVDAVERDPELFRAAHERLNGAEYGNVRLHLRDGTLGVHEHAPYDAILVSAAGPRVPRALQEQLAPRGRLVMPVDVGQGEQRLVRLTRREDGSFVRDEMGRVQFVPLIGAQGWPVSAVAQDAD